MAPRLLAPLALAIALSWTPLAFADEAVSTASITSARSSLSGSVAARRNAVRVLVKAGPAAAGAYDDLLAALEDSDAWVRWGAVQALTHIRPSSADLPTLLELAHQDPDARVRFAALEALIRQGGSTLDPASPLLQDRDPGVRLQAVRLLAWKGRPYWRPVRPEGNEAVTSQLAALQAALGDEDLLVRMAVIASLEGHGSRAFPALALALQDDHVFVRRAAARLITAHKLDGTGSIAPALIKGLDDLDPTTRALCFEALERALSGTEPALEVLAAAAADPKEEDAIRRSAVLALEHLLDSHPREVLAAYEALLDSQASDAAKAFLANVAARHPEQAAELALPLAILWTRTPSTTLRAQLEAALLELGASAKKRGQVMWWVLPRAYLWETLALLAALALWFGFARRFPKVAPRSRAVRAGHFLQVCLPATLLCTQATHFVVTLPWAADYLPEPFLVLLPLPLTVVLSTAFVCALAALGAIQRSPSAEDLREPSSLEPPGVGEVGERLGSLAPEQGELSAGLGEEVLDA